MSDTKISDTAVEAAAMVVAGSRAEWFGYTPDVKDGLKEIQRAALTAALPHLHQQPAEPLININRAHEFLLHVRKCLDKNGEYAPLSRAELDGAIATLEGDSATVAAVDKFTGRAAELAEQQGVFQEHPTHHVYRGACGSLPCYCWANDDHVIGDEVKRFAATGKQQVGEVQGDALATLAANWRACADKHELSALELDSIGDMPATVDAHETKSEVFRQVAAKLDAALAASQPGAQEPVGEVYQGSARLPQARLSKPLPIGSLLYTAPPAQGIDLSRVRASIQSLLNWVDDWAETPEESGINAIEAEAEAVLALIDQRDEGQRIDLEGAK